MNLAKKLWMTTGDSSGGSPAPSGGYVDDVFSTYVYKGNGANRSFVTGQNLLADGGMVWTKGRSGTYGATDHYLFHTERGSDIFLSTNTSNGQGAFTAGTSVSSFNNDGFSLGTSLYVNNSATEYVSWVFKNAPKFYGHQVVTKVAGTSKIVNFPELVTLGMVRVKKIDGTGSWYVWHRSMTAGQLLIGESAAAAATLGHVTVSGTTVTLNNGVIADGQYLVEAFAHNTALDGLVQCSSFTTSGSSASITLGWEPQYVMFKRISGAADNWYIVDATRGLGAPTSDANARLLPNLADAETAASTSGLVITSTGFQAQLLASSESYVYVAIRRPNKPPTSGVGVYAASTYLNVHPQYTAGFPVDVAIRQYDRVSGGTFELIDRLRGANQLLQTCAVNAEGAGAGGRFDLMTGFSLNGATNSLGWMFRRAPGFMDVVCDIGNGVPHAIAHNLTKAPELIIRKGRSSGQQWEVWHSALSASDHLVLNSTAAKETDNTVWNSTVPTATAFTVGNSGSTNAINATFVTYLFATLPGISKVGRYNGNGGTQTIPCGFTTGSRFVLIKRIDNTGDWFVWDTARGITPTTDPHLSLNTTAAEVTTDDSIDQDASGFVVNQNAATNINALGGNYLFLAIA